MTPDATNLVQKPANAREPWGKLGVAVLVAAVLLGGSLRLYDLGGPSFSDDELFKVNAVNSYRQGQWTLTGDDEHPLAMKLLIYVAYGVRDLWNTYVAAPNTPLELGLESATRGPNALVGTFIALLLAFLGRELFSRRVGLIAAMLWAVEVNVIGYNRIAKEDTLLTFFLLLALYFVVRAKRMAEAGDERRAFRYQLAAAMACGGLAATKYFLHLLFIIPLFYLATRTDVVPVWRVPLRRWALMLGVAVLTAIAINPTVFHPANLEYILGYIGHKTIFTHGVLFNGEVHMNNVFEMFSGTPWYYYFVYLWVKLAIPILAMVLVGLAVTLARRRHEGSKLLFVWMGVWLLVHAILSGAKWGRFVTHLMPVVLLLAAIGVDHFAEHLAKLWRRARRAMHEAAPVRARGVAAFVLGALVAGGALYAPAVSAPHYRMFLNALGGAKEGSRHYFPHCDHYDVGVREAVQYVCARAEQGAQLRSDANVVAQHYVDRCNRPDIKVTTLSKPQDACEPGRPCYQILQVARTFFETQGLFQRLYSERPPDAVVRVQGVNVAEVYAPTPASTPTATAAIRTAGDALRLGAIARAFGNHGTGEVVASALPTAQPARPEPREPRRYAAVTGAFRFASDVVLETLDTQSPPQLSPQALDPR
jgi:hypothetical protein